MIKMGTSREQYHVILQSLQRAQNEQAKALWKKIKSNSKLLEITSEEKDFLLTALEKFAQDQFEAAELRKTFQDMSDYYAEYNIAHMVISKLKDTCEGDYDD